MGTDFGMAMNEFLPLRDVVFNTLRKAILTGELKPGERLMEIHLADKLGVSRTPIREALKKLESEGLLHHFPSRGTFVASLSIQDVEAASKDGTLQEAWATGTACVISPIGTLRYKGEDIVINGGAVGDLSQKLYDTMTGMQWGKLPDNKGWIVPVCQA